MIITAVLHNGPFSTTLVLWQDPGQSEPVIADQDGPDHPMFLAQFIATAMEYSERIGPQSYATAGHEQ